MGALDGLMASVQHTASRLNVLVEDAVAFIGQALSLIREPFSLIGDLLAFASDLLALVGSSISFGRATLTLVELAPLLRDVRTVRFLWFCRPFRRGVREMSESLAHELRRWFFRIAQRAPSTLQLRSTALIFSHLALKLSPLRILSLLPEVGRALVVYRRQLVTVSGIPMICRFVAH